VGELMRICPLCDATYDDDIEFCFKDGTPLESVDRPGDEGGFSSLDEEYSVRDSIEFLPPDAAGLTGEHDALDEPDDEPDEDEDLEAADMQPGIRVVPGAMTSPLDDEESVDAHDPFAVPFPDEGGDATGPDDMLALVSGELPLDAEETLKSPHAEAEPADDDGVLGTDGAPAPTVEPPEAAVGDEPPPIGEEPGPDTAWMDDTEVPDRPAVADSTEEEQPDESDPLYASIEPGVSERKKGIILWIVLGMAALLSLCAFGYALISAKLGGDAELTPVDPVLNVDHSPEERTPRHTPQPTPAEPRDGLAEQETPGEEPTEAEDPTEAIDEEQPTPEPEEATPEPPTPEPPTPEPPTPEPPTPEPPTPEPPTPEPTEDGAADTGSTNPWLSPVDTTSSPTPADPANPWTTASAQPQTGKVTVSSAPVGATFYVDSQLRGTSPLTVDVPFGHHTVRVELEGYLPQERGISVQSGTVFVDFTLERAVAPSTGKLTVHTNPQPGATLYVDGTARGKTPITLDISPGVHTLRVELAGFPTKEETIDLSTLQPGENRRRVISME